MAAWIWWALIGLAVQGIVIYTAVRAAILHSLALRDSERRAQAEKDQMLEQHGGGQ